MRTFAILAILMLSVAMPAHAADPADAVVNVPACRDEIVPYLSLSYEGRTIAKADVAGTVLREKESEIKAMATAAGITRIEGLGSNYTVYSQNNASALMCAGTPIEFKPGETMVQVKTNYELDPLDKVSAFIDALIAKGYIPTVNEMKRQVCE